MSSENTNNNNSGMGFSTVLFFRVFGFEVE